jgi:tetratricopeptide (TPR) repeat protein
MKKCPFCQQKIPDKVTKCRHCGERLDTVSPPQQEAVVKPPKNGQSGTDSIDWQTKIAGILKEYRTHIISIIIIAGLLFTISQMANFNKRAEKVTVIEPPKVEAPVTSTPEPTPTQEPAPAPNSVINLYNNAFALCSSGKCTDPQKAIEYLNEVIKLKPDLAEAYNNRGNAYGDLGQHQQAITDYNEAIRLKPDYAHAYSNRGDAYLNQGDKISGCGDLSKACNLGDCGLYEEKKQKGDCILFHNGPSY